MKWIMFNWTCDLCGDTGYESDVEEDVPPGWVKDDDGNDVCPECQEKKES